jgi:hypothetical protein
MRTRLKGSPALPEEVLLSCAFELTLGGGATLREHVKVVEMRQLCHFVILELGLSQAEPKGVTSLTVI